MLRGNGDPGAPPIRHDYPELLVRYGKGKDRRTVLPSAAKNELLQRLDRLRPYYERDVRDGVGVSLPDALDRKYPRAATEWGW